MAMEKIMLVFLLSWFWVACKMSKDESPPALGKSSTDASNGDSDLNTSHGEPMSPCEEVSGNLKLGQQACPTPSGKQGYDGGERWIYECKRAPAGYKTANGYMWTFVRRTSGHYPKSNLCTKYSIFYSNCDTVIAAPNDKREIPCDESHLGAEAQA